MNDHRDLDAQRRLRRAVDRLPRELRPARDLWPGIAGRLDEQPRRGGAGWWRLAAAVALTTGGLLAAVALRPEAPAPRQRVAPASSVGAGPALAATHLRQRDGVLHVHNDLIAAAARRRGRLDEAGAAALAAGLAELERAAAEIEEALARNPKNRRLRLAMAAAYRRESGWTSRLGHV